MSEFAKYCETPGGYAEYVLLHLFGTVERFEQFLEDNLYPPIESVIEKQYQQALKSLNEKLKDEMWRNHD